PRRGSRGSRGSLAFARAAGKTSGSGDLSCPRWPGRSVGGSLSSFVIRFLVRHPPKTVYTVHAGCGPAARRTVGPEEAGDMPRNPFGRVTKLCPDSRK